MTTDLRESISTVSLSGIGKKFNRRWIFRNVDLELQRGDRLAISGNNGSGKSTLLKLISGYLTPSEGTILWKGHQGIMPPEHVSAHLSCAAPYLDLIERFSLKENIEFFCRMKPLYGGITKEEMMAISGLSYASSTPVLHLSSGMKQRLKLTLALLADTELLLLDEPLSNLDETGYRWYRDLCERFFRDRMVVICSNRVPEETEMCRRTVVMEDYRKDFQGML